MNADVELALAIALALLVLIVWLNVAAVGFIAASTADRLQHELDDANDLMAFMVKYSDHQTNEARKQRAYIELLETRWWAEPNSTMPLLDRVRRVEQTLLGEVQP